MNAIEHTIGDSFELTGTVTEPSTGLPTDITGWTITATARLARKTAENDNLEFTCTVIDATAGVYKVEATTIQTALWKKRAEYRAKIKFVKSDGFTFHSPEFTIKVRDDN